MDNFKIDVTAEGFEALKMVFEIAAPKCGGINGYKISGQELTFHWHCESGKEYHPFPFEMDAAGAADFANRWLKTVKYGPEPDHDGSNKKAWRAYKSNTDFYAVLTISPEWGWLGK